MYVRAADDETQRPRVKATQVLAKNVEKNMGDLRWGGTLIVTSRVYSQVYDGLTPGRSVESDGFLSRTGRFFWMNSAGKKLELFSCA